MNRIQAKKLQAEIDKRAEEVVQRLQQKGIIGHDSTGAMASAWFGTPGAGKAVDRVFGKQSHSHDDYKQLEVPQGVQLAPCPVCRSAAALWQYSTSETAPRELAVMCTNGEKFGPQEGLVNEGCLLYMPPINFYRETIRDAVRYWNEYAQALVALRADNAAGAVWTEADQAAWMALPEEERRRRNHAADAVPTDDVPQVPMLKATLRQLIDEVKQHAYAPQFEHLGPLVLQAEALLAKGE